MAAPTSNLSREPVPPSGHAITAESGAKWQVRDLSGLTLNTLPRAIAKNTSQCIILVLQYEVA